jgi:hypothetical protein
VVYRATPPGDFYIARYALCTASRLVPGRCPSTMQTRSGNQCNALLMTSANAQPV